MSLVLTLVHAPHPQAVRQMRLEAGELVIGRGAEADWRIEDPDMFVSRAHCTVRSEAGRFTVTDTSSGGLFLDESGRPLGTGNSASLRDGMRLRLGDYIVSVALPATAASTPRSVAHPRSAAPEFDADDFFSTPVAEEPRPPRPADLPDPFDRPPSSAADPAPPERKAPPDFDDPFTLDPPARVVPDPPRDAPPGFDWGLPGGDGAEPRPEPRPRHPPAEFDWGPSAAPPAASAPPAPPPCPVAAPAPPQPAPPQAPPPQAAPSPGDAAALAAFLRGLGLDPAEAGGRDAAARLEAFGREYRLMAEGLMHLLRKRAEEKVGARIAQTVIGATDVNPLKFMPNVDQALGVMAADRHPGFTDSEAAIVGAIRDLAQHHVDAWRGIQSALRRMVERFDPVGLEKELEEIGRLETLLAGGRSAKLWDLYEKRYAEIAASAETRFLGEIGEHFREAYERGRR